MSIYVVDSIYQTTDEYLIKMVNSYVSVPKASVTIDKKICYSKSFGFVTMENEQKANNSISTLSSKEIQVIAAEVNPTQNKPASLPHQSHS